MGGQAQVKGPDLEKEGARIADVANGAMVEGHVGEAAVLLARQGSNWFAIGAQCTHYSGPLAEGIIVDGCVRCPWHHARFDLKTGEAVGAPALNPVACWNVEARGDRVFVTSKKSEHRPGKLPIAAPQRVVAIGAGAAGAAFVEALRREGFDGDITLVGKDPALPVDRPNLSKDYLAGTAPEEWLSLRDRDFYASQKVTLKLGSDVRAVDAAKKTIALGDGTSLPFDALLLATGADPVRLPLPGSDLPHVFTLRSVADSKAIIAALPSAKRAVVIGASFIGLEVAASLRARGLEVDVVAPDTVPLGKVLGEEVGAFVRGLHEAKGVRFHLEKKPSAITKQAVTLDSGESLPCELVVMGVGVRPALDVAKSAGCEVDGGVLTNEYLETSVPGIYAAGDIARYRTPGGERFRVEHWVHAERQGQVAAANIVGKKKPYDHAPFFWSVHYDVTINYVGHAEKVDRVQIAGSLEKRDATIAYRTGGLIKAIATIGRDQASLRAGAAFERGDNAALEALLA